MHYIVCYMNYESTQSEVFHSYNEAHKRAVKLASKCENYDYVLIYKVDNNKKEHLIRVLTSY
jgi:hypothetical protein